MKRIRLLSLCLVVLFCSAVGLTACSGSPHRSDSVTFFYFLYKEKSTYTTNRSTITGKTLEDGGAMVDAVVPIEYKGLPVTEIGWDTFRESQVLRSVIIPEGIVGIHGYSFYNCDSLEKVHLPKSMQNFHGTCFASCNSLEAVTVDPENPWFCSIDGVVYTKDGKELVFYPPGKEDSEFFIPEGVTTIGMHAFNDCKNLKRIFIPYTVNEITYDSIYTWWGLEGVFVDERNETYRSINGDLYSKDGKSFLRLCRQVGNLHLVIPEGVEMIGNGAVYSNNSLRSVSIPETVTHIGRRAFWGCEGITEITIPAATSFIGSGAFSGCLLLSEVHFLNPYGWSSVPEFFSANSAIFDDGELTSPTDSAKYIVEDYLEGDWKRKD